MGAVASVEGGATGWADVVIIGAGVGEDAAAGAGAVDSGAEGARAVNIGAGDSSAC